jgi:hypothetical protein
MWTKHILAGLVIGPLVALGQTKVDLGAQSRDIDFSTMSFVRPFRTSTALPTTCVTGEMFFDTAAPAGLNTYGCVAANTWALQGPAPVQGVAPIQVVLSSSTTLTIGAACSITTPCLSRLGSIVYSVSAPITVTVQGGAGLAYIYVSSVGSITVGTSLTGPTLSCSGCQLQSGITQFPVDAIPLASWNATTGAWDSTGTVVSTAVSAGRAFTAGQNITLVQSGSNVMISANTANTGYNPLDMTMFDRTYVFAEAGMSAIAPWSVISANCTSGAGTAGVAGEPGSVGWSASGNACFVYYPGANGSGAYAITDFLSGSNPQTYTLTGRYARGNSAGLGTGDHYIGWSSAQDGTVANFVGIRYLASASQWQCVIRSAGSDVASQAIAVTPDAAFHTFAVSNGGVANSVTCKIGSMSQTTVGTITAASRYAVMGTIISAGLSYFSAMEARIHISGIPR